MNLKNSTVLLLFFAVASSVLLNSFLISNATIPTRIDEPCHDAPVAPLPAEGKKNDEYSISACLLIKDDNDILSEWLAYHYHALNMRYLVVAVDPTSETSPTAILDRWRSLTNLKILEWDEEDFMPADFLQRGYHRDPKSLNTDASRSPWHEGHEDPQTVLEDTTIIENHRFRQRNLVASCFHHMRDLGKRWVMHIDTDEYVVVNPLLRKNNTKSVTVPSVEEAGSLASVLRQSIDTLKEQANYPCISMPRLLFGSVEKADEDLATKTPDGLNATLFETVRWVHHAGYEDKERNAFPKVIVDIPALPSSESDAFFAHTRSIHRPSRKICLGYSPLSSAERFPLSVNHYVGSKERFMARNDSRRSESGYHLKADVDEGRDTWISSWLRGFVEAEGRQRALHLLREYTSPGATDGMNNDEDATLSR